MFLIALSVVVVLSIMMMANSLFTSKVRENTIDISVSDRAAIVAESAVEEVSYDLLKKLNDPASKMELYKKVRQFDPSKLAAPPEDALFEPGMSAVLKPELTARAYQDSPDTRAGDVRTGPFERLPLSVTQESNESYGTFGFQESAFVTPPGNYRSVEEQVFFLKAYKVVLLAPPIPFNKYTLFLRDSQRFRKYFERYQQAAQEIEVFNRNVPAAQQLELPAFPLADPGSNRPVLCTTDVLDPAELTVPAFAPGASTNPAQLVAALTTQFGRIAAKLSRQSAADAADFESKRTYDQFTADSLKRHATHVFDNFAELAGLVSRNGTLVLNGFYFVKREVTLNQPWTGRGVIATESSEGISIKSAPRQGEGRLVLIASNGPIDLGGLSSGETLEADLMAPNGLLQGHTNKKLKGCVLVRDLEAVPDAYTSGPAIARPGDSDYEAWSGSSDMPAAYAKQLAFFLNPGFLKREYLSRRQKRQ